MSAYSTRSWPCSSRMRWRKIAFTMPSSLLSCRRRSRSASVGAAWFGFPKKYSHGGPPPRAAIVGGFQRHDSRPAVQLRNQSEVLERGGVGAIVPQSQIQLLARLGIAALFDENRGHIVVSRS